MKTLVILHGWQSSKEKWQTVKEIIENQSEDRPRSIRVVVPDLPGFKKETELDRVWDLDDYIKWLEDFSSDISEPFYLLGHSFGGRMAIKFAAKYPEKLKGLILVSSAGIIPKKNAWQIFLSKIAKLGNKFSLLPFYPFFRKLFYKYILRKTDYINAEKMPELQETFKKIITEDLTDYLSQIKIPTLIIWGEKDKMTPLSDAYLMKEKIKNSRLEIMEGIAHIPHLENPEVLSQKIINFINSLEIKRG